MTNTTPLSRPVLLGSGREYASFGRVPVPVMIPDKAPAYDSSSQRCVSHDRCGRIHGVLGDSEPFFEWRSEEVDQA